MRPIVLPETGTSVIYTAMLQCGEMKCVYRFPARRGKGQMMPCPQRSLQREA